VKAKRVRIVLLYELGDVAVPGARANVHANQWVLCGVRARGQCGHGHLGTRRVSQGGAIRFKLRQPAARRRYARRKVIIEPIFGQLKEDRGDATLSLRDLVLAKTECVLACVAHNLGKLFRVCTLPASPLALACLLVDPGPC
jgi:hypothetical protein